MQQDEPAVNLQPESSRDSEPLTATSPSHPPTHIPAHGTTTTISDHLIAKDSLPEAESISGLAQGAEEQEKTSVPPEDKPSAQGEGTASFPREKETGADSGGETRSIVGEVGPEVGRSAETEGSTAVESGDKVVLVHAEVEVAGTREEGNSPPSQDSQITVIPQGAGYADLATAADPLSSAAIVEPTPSALLPSSTLLSSTPSSTASTPVLAAAQLPSSAVPAYVAPAKKFASSLSVNKKFLEKAGAEKSKPEVKAAVARLATPPIVAPVSTAHPRLLTGKISTVPVVSATAAPTVSGPSGWLKNAPFPEGQPKLTLPSQSDITSRGGSYERAKGMTGFGAGRGRGSAVWGSRNGSVGDLGMGGEFPTAAEAANVKAMRAAAITEQTQAKERASQARAAAAAATNAHLLQGLDAFRGVHLDPNASHWDEMGDEDNDFLDDTIEFADGTQYKIEAETHAPSPLGPRKVSDDAVDEPDPSDFATLEAPLVPGEAVHNPIRSERFKDDFDRTWARPTPAAGDSKNLFNERLGKFESYGNRKTSTPGSILGHHPEPPHSSDHFERGAPPHENRPRTASITSPRLGKATLPPPAGRPWGRDAPPTTEWREGGSDPRRRSIEQGARRPSFGQSVRRPSIEQTIHRPTVDHGGRQLPPHLVGTVPPPRSLDRHEAPPHRAPLSPPQLVRPLTVHPTVSTSIPKPDAPPSRPLPPSNAAPVPTASVAPITAPAAVVDLDELHAREMHAAAERAKKRRQEEEERVTAESKERARKRLEDLEARLTAEAKAKAPEATVSAPAPVSIHPKVEKPQERADFWRDRSSAKVAPPRAPAPAPAPTKIEPTQILSRGEPPHLSVRPTPAPSSSATFSSPPLPLPHSMNATTSSSAPLPASRPSLEHRKSNPIWSVEERVWRRKDSTSHGSVPPASTQTEPTVSRQLPPHLQSQAEASPRVAINALSSTEVQFIATPTPLAQVPLPRSAPALPLSSPTEPPSPPPQSRKVAQPAPKATQPYKLPVMSTLEDLMSRVKGAMSVPKPSTSPDLSDNVSRSDSSSPSQIPTVKLPTAKGKLATPAQLSISTRVASPIVPDPLEIVSKPDVIASESRGKGRGRPEAKKSLPISSAQKADVPFDATRLERSPSPPPAWKAFAVRLAAYRKLRSVQPRQVKLFYNPRSPAKVNILSWEPQADNLPRNLSRHEHLFPIPKALRNSVIVRLSNQAIPSNSSPLASTIKVPASRQQAGVNINESYSTSGSAPVRGTAPGGADQTLWRRAMQDSLSNQVRSSNVKPSPLPLEALNQSVDATTAPSTSGLFDPLSPGLPITSKVPSASPDTFYRGGDGPEDVTPISDLSRKFMVTSELNGVAVEMAPRESMDAPGADSPSENPSKPGFDSTASPMMTTPWAAPSPVSLAVLNPTALSVWSAPPADSPAHSRSVSLGGAKPENSLEGVADPDDFPVPSTTSFADLKTDFEATNEATEVPKRAAKDEARLRAAAPAFTFYPASSPPQPTYPREPLAFQPSGTPLYSPNSFPGVPLQPHALHYAPPQPRLYQNPYSVQQQQLTPHYGASPLQSHQAYPPSALAISPSTQTHPFPNYRGVITNPALIAQAQGYVQPSYGVVGGSGGGAFGAVGGGLTRPGVHQGSSYIRSPSATPQYAPLGGYMNGGAAVRVDGYGSPSLGYPVSPVPLPQHLQQPYSLPQQQQGYRPAGFRTPWSG